MRIVTNLRPLSDGILIALVEAAPDALVCMDASGRIALVNAEVERLFGYQREELIGEPVEVSVPDGIPAAPPGLQADFVADTGPARWADQGRD